MMGSKLWQSPWKVQHGKHIEACSPGRMNHSREQTLYLIKRANQCQIYFNKLQGQTTERVQADVLLLQRLVDITKYNSSISLIIQMHSSQPYPHSQCEWWMSKWCQHKDSLNKCVILLLSLYCSWSTVDKTVKISDCREISTVDGHSKKKNKGGGWTLMALMLLCIMKKHLRCPLHSFSKQCCFLSPRVPSFTANQ